MSQQAHQELQALAEKMGTVAAYLQQCAQQAADGVTNSQQQLRQVTQGFDAQTRQLSRDAVNEISRQAQQAIVQGLSEASDECNTRLKSTGEAANQAIYHLNQQVQALQKTQKNLVWKAGLALMLGMVLAMIGLGVYGWQLSQQVQRSNYPLAVLNAMQAGQITSCSGKLCVKVGKNPRRAGNNGEYLLLEP